MLSLRKNSRVLAHRLPEGARRIRVLVENRAPGTQPRPRLRPVGRLVRWVRRAVQRTRLAWRRGKRAWLPRLRRAGQAALVVAALAGIVVVDINQKIDTLPVLPSTSEIPSGPRSPADGDVNIPEPWGVQVPQLPEPGPVISSPHIGFRDLPDLRGAAEPGGSAAKIRGGLSSDGLPPRLDVTGIASVVGVVALFTAMASVILNRCRRRQRTTQPTIDTSSVTTEIDQDQPPREHEDAGEATRGADAEGEPAEANPAESVADGSTASSRPQNTGTPAQGQPPTAPQAADGSPPQEGSTRDVSAHPAANSGRTAFPSQTTENKPRSSDAAASRVVLYTATKWDR